MAKAKGNRRIKDPSAGGKRAPRFHDDTPDSLEFHGAIPGLAEAAEGFEAEGPTHSETSLAQGVGVLEKAVKTLPESPGVYRMLNRRNDVLYVGKAKNLRKRVYSYTQISKQPRRLQRMIAETCGLEIVRTNSEVEALLLESNLIKRFMPRYNVLLRDDKSFPYIFLSSDHSYPRLTKHRGSHEREGAYYGPFASAGAVNRTLTALEKAFLLRSCSDHVFANRTRPCLLYQIKRCSAPCVGRISQQEYGQLVEAARAFLSGRDSAIQGELAGLMQEAAENLDFETAARYRDRIRALAHIQSSQDVNVEGINDADVIAVHQEGGQSCIQVFFFRAGRNYGNRSYFPGHDSNLETTEVLGAFLAQFYDNKPVPAVVLLSHEPAEKDLLLEALEMRAGHRIRMQVPRRGEKRKLLETALLNAKEALSRRQADVTAQSHRMEELAQLLELDGPPERIEVYDNSHIQGSNPYGVMIVAGPEGFRKNAYRKFAIRSLKDRDDIGDDYAMMREVLTRRFSRAVKEDPDRQGGQWPDLVLLDGGRGQLSVAEEVFAELGIEDMPVAGVAKGPDRDAGRERIFLPGREPFLLTPDTPLLHYIQRLRDEAHRFAIGTHRAGRSKSRLTSSLDGVPGIGAKRKKALLLHFGSARAVEQAALADLEAVDGISRTVAKKIHEHFHE
ncbi:excinuclease ABC subunit UvrC [Fodinicurvata halophila]|uniref:UvrABC system protein C n=1 Tax=Fodinicurvata halophila TaxID=1419723 RepID=A0ABV8UQG4_9PROT